jgi:hypothetical protein
VAVMLLHRSAGLQLERTIFMGEECRARPVIIPLVRRCQQRTVSLRATATAAIWWPRFDRIRTKKACRGPSALAAAHAASTSIARAWLRPTLLISR